MSAILTGAVFNCGPSKGSLRLALVAITDNSDDYGFACPSIESIAQRACCDARTAMRLVQALERDGWMKVRRKVLFGKGNVYFIDIARLGVEINPKSRKSPLHLEVAKLLEKKDRKPSEIPAKKEQPDSHDKLSPEKPAASEDSGDNPQGSQVTKTPDSGDKKPVRILSNRKEPLLNPNKDTTPQPPSKSRGASGEEARPVPEQRPALLGERSACAAVQLVMRECDLTDRRMAPVIENALRGYAAKKGNRELLEIAALMVANRKDYLAHSTLMRHPVGPRKFFAHGLCFDDRLWPWDQALVREARRL